VRAGEAKLPGREGVIFLLLALQSSVVVAFPFLDDFVRISAGFKCLLVSLLAYFALCRVLLTLGVFDGRRAGFCSGFGHFVDIREGLKRFGVY